MTDLQFIKLLEMVIAIAEGCKERDEIIEKLKKIAQRDKEED